MAQCTVVATLDTLSVCRNYLLLLNGGSLLGALGFELAVNKTLSQGGENRSLLLLGSDLSRYDGGRSLGQRNDILVSVLSNVGQLVSSGVALLGLLARLGEDNQLRLELVDTVDIHRNSGLALVAASLVNGDSNGTSQLDWHSRLLELNGGESATLSELEVVPLSLRNNNGSQQTGNWSWENSCGLSLTSQSASLMTGWLVEPSLREGVLLEVVNVWQDTLVNHLSLIT